MTLNQTAWKLKHQLLTDSINRTGTFDLEEINRKVFDTLKINSYELPEENQSGNRVIDALKKILNKND